MSDVTKTDNITVTHLVYSQPEKCLS